MSSFNNITLAYSNTLNSWGDMSVSEQQGVVGWCDGAGETSSVGA